MLAACQNATAEGRDESAAGRCWLQVKMRPLKAEMRLLPADVGCTLQTPVWFINSCKSFSIGCIPISNYLFLNRIINFRSKGFCLAGSSNARQKHKFPNGIIKLQFENYDSFLNYKLFIGLIKCLKKERQI
jgi:hypothetical protein